MSEPCINSDRITRHGIEIDHVGKELEKHIERGVAWRIAVAGTAAVLLVQLGTAVYFYGRLMAIVDNHDRGIQRLETKVLK